MFRLEEVKEKKHAFHSQYYSRNSYDFYDNQTKFIECASSVRLCAHFVAC